MQPVSRRCHDDDGAQAKIRSRRRHRAGSSSTAAPTTRAAPHAKADASQKPCRAESPRHSGSAASLAAFSFAAAASSSALSLLDAAALTALSLAAASSWAAVSLAALLLASCDTLAAFSLGDSPANASAATPAMSTSLMNCGSGKVGGGSPPGGCALHAHRPTKTASDAADAAAILGDRKSVV